MQKRGSILCSKISGAGGRLQGKIIEIIKSEVKKGFVTESTKNYGKVEEMYMNKKVL